MPTSLEPLMTSEPAHALDAVENLVAMKLVNHKQARLLRVLAMRADHMTVMQQPDRRAVTVRMGNGDAMRITSSGRMQYQ